MASPAAALKWYQLEDYNKKKKLYGFGPFSHVWMLGLLAGRETDMCRTSPIIRVKLFFWRISNRRREFA
jgi:hypothetical protein